MSPRSSSDNAIKGKIGLAGAVILLMFSIGGCAVYRMSAENRTITVKRLERVTQNTDEGVKSKYLVFTDTRTYEVVDSWSFMRFNSSDCYGRLKEGHRYNIVAAGWRFGLLSWYENIIEIRQDLGPLPVGTPGNPGDPNSPVIEPPTSGALEPGATMIYFHPVRRIVFRRTNVKPQHVDAAIRTVNEEWFGNRLEIERLKPRHLLSLWRASARQHCLKCGSLGSTAFSIKMPRCLTIEFPCTNGEWEQWAQGIFLETIAHKWDGDIELARQYEEDLRAWPSLARNMRWAEWCRKKYPQDYMVEERLKHRTPKGLENC